MVHLLDIVNLLMSINIPLQKTDSPNGSGLLVGLVPFLAMGLTKPRLQHQNRPFISIRIPGKHKYIERAISL